MQEHRGMAQGGSRPDQTLGSPRRKGLARMILLYSLMVIMTACFFFPYFFAVSSSLKQPWEIHTWPPTLVPAVPQWRNYAEVFRRAPFALWLYNTVALVFLSTSGGVITSSMVAFGFARFSYRFRDFLFMVTLATMMLPAQVTLIPQFILFHRLGEWTPVQFLDTLRPLWVPSWFGGGAFGIFLMRQFIQTIPRDLDEAALIDGANYFRIYAQVIMPLCKPALVTLSVVTALAAWNVFITPLIYINSPQKFPVSVGLHYFNQGGGFDMGEPKEHLLMCASVMSTIVPIILFFTAQNAFVRGVVMSGIKG